MKTIKRIFLIVIIISAIGFVFREWFFNQAVSFRSIGLRTTYLATNPQLIKFIDSGTIKQIDPDIKEIIRTSLSLTSTHLNFTADRNDNDPNLLISSKTAHCIGYASFFATSCNYLIKKYNLDDDWTAKPQIGQLYFYGTNVHKYLRSPFLKDHDFVVIENRTTGEILAVDPTIHDYLGINFVKYSK